MYLLKEEIIKELRAKYREDYFAKEVGISRTYISLIFNRKRKCPKRVAFCIAKTIDNNAEVDDYFERV